MIDTRSAVYNILNSVGYPVSYQYPKSFASFPCISYWDSGHTATDYQDGIADIDVVEYTVDVWEKENADGQIIEIHNQVDLNMRSAGYKRTQFVSLYEIDTHVFHFQIKFIKIESEVN